MVDVLESLMLLCFGSAWPFSIWKSFRSKKNEGKSVYFLWIILIGYLSGIAHKFFEGPDRVILLYILNTLMVSADIAIYYRNKSLENATRY